MTSLHVICGLGPGYAYKKGVGLSKIGELGGDKSKTNDNVIFFCRKPLLIEAREVGTYIPASKTGDVLKRFNVYHGLICDNRDQISERCHDYEVRYLCSPTVTNLSQLYDGR